jgi:hypothetical protein
MRRANVVAHARRIFVKNFEEGIVGIRRDIGKGNTAQILNHGVL